MGKNAFVLNIAMGHMKENVAFCVS
ncbi:hypothetical protein ACM26V_06930 [Salipaludibacillus sp. HK11]